MFNREIVMKSKFNFNSQICTNKIQSIRLLALGLRKETADIFIGIDWDNELTYDNNGGYTSNLDASITAWSLNRLIEMMPFDVIIEGGFDNCFTLIKNYPKGYSVEYDGFSYYHKENIYDTIIDGIEHLIKEGHFNKGYLEE